MPDGTVLAPPGGGYSTSGRSTRAVVSADMLIDEVDEMRRRIEAAPDVILRHLPAGSGRYRLGLVIEFVHLWIRRFRVGIASA